MAPEEHELIISRINDLKDSVDRMLEHCNVHMARSTEKNLKIEHRLTVLETKMITWSGAIGFLAGAAVQLGMVAFRLLIGAAK